MICGTATGPAFAQGSQPQSAVDPSSAHSARVFGKKHNIEGIDNFAQVTPLLFRGAQPTRHGLEVLAKMGVDIVVDARGNRANSEGRQVHAMGMEYVAIPWHCPFPHDDAFVKFLKLLKDNPHKKVFVHCRLGDDRSGMMIAAYRMAAEHWSADDAMLEMKHFGFTRAHHFICPSLASYERNFPSHLKNNPAFEGLY